MSAPTAFVNSFVKTVTCVCCVSFLFFFSNAKIKLRQFFSSPALSNFFYGGPLTYTNATLLGQSTVAQLAVDE